MTTGELIGFSDIGDINQLTLTVAKPEGEQGGQLPPHCQIVCPF